MLAIAKAAAETLRRTKPPICHSLSVMECSLTRHDGDAFLAGCLTMAIFLRADLHRCAGHRIIAGDADVKVRRLIQSPNGL